MRLAAIAVAAVLFGMAAISTRALPFSLAAGAAALAAFAVFTWLVSRLILAVAGGLLIGIFALMVAGLAWDYSGIDTAYPTGYSEERFADVQAGMTKPEVERLIGEGLCRDRDYLTSYRGKYAHECGGRFVPYSYTPHKMAYRVRGVRYNGSGRVVGKVREFYVD